MNIICRRFLFAIVPLCIATGMPHTLFAAPEQTDAPTAKPAATPADDENQPAPDKKDPNFVRLSPDYDAWLDKKNKQIVLEGRVCLNEGPLEMFACPLKTKEHESILKIRTSAQAIHAALVAVGAKPGNTVKFDPKYVPASGTEIEIQLAWKDQAGKQQTARAQDWIKDTNTGKAMTYPWVFAGSGFWLDEMTGKRTYLADTGDFICVSNFSSAMLDLPVKSTDMADVGLQFEAFQEKIPPKGTWVTVTLSPKLEQKKEEPKAKPAAQ
jgi:hypothetical protein